MAITINSVTQTIANNNWPTGQIDPFTMDFVYTPVTNQTIKLRTTSTSNNTFELVPGGDSKVVIQQINNSFALNAIDTISTTGNVTVGGILSSPQQTKASNATGTVGQICWDANYIYVCTATDTWKRTALTGGY